MPAQSVRSTLQAKALGRRCAKYTIRPWQTPKSCQQKASKMQPLRLCTLHHLVPSVSALGILGGGWGRGNEGYPTCDPFNELRSAGDQQWHSFTPKALAVLIARLGICSASVGPLGFRARIQIWLESTCATASSS